MQPLSQVEQGLLTITRVIRPLSLVMVSSSCSTSDRGRITLVMESSSCSTSGRGRIALVMVSRSCSTFDRGRVTYH
jgi:hypothetical protein